MDYNKDYYNELGIDKNATNSEIKKQYRTLSKKHHPDVNGGKDEKFKLISEAYEILSDSNKKQEYDTRSPNGNSYSQFNPFGGFSFGGTGFEDMFGQVFGGNSQFGSFFRREEFAENLDINININIDINNIYNNNKIVIKYQKYIKCEDCDGTGFDKTGHSDTCDVCDGKGINNGKICDYCQGTGKIHSGKCKVCNGEKIILKDSEVTLQNISEIRNSTRSIQRGYGSQSKYYRDKIGSLILNITNINTSKYEIVNNYDLNTIIDIHYQDAIDGNKIIYNHIDNSKIEIKIPEKTKNNDTFKVKEKGLLKNDGKRADLYLKINIIIDYDKLNTQKTN